MIQYNVKKIALDMDFIYISRWKNVSSKLKKIYTLIKMLINLSAKI